MLVPSAVAQLVERYTGDRRLASSSLTTDRVAVLCPCLWARVEDYLSAALFWFNPGRPVLTWLKNFWMGVKIQNKQTTHAEPRFVTPTTKLFNGTKPSMHTYCLYNNWPNFCVLVGNSEQEGFYQRFWLCMEILWNRFCQARSTMTA